MPPKVTRKPAPTPTRKSAPSKRAAPKAPRSIDDRLKRLFSSLSSQIDGSHFKNALKTCDKILRLSPVDEDALRTKLVLLLQLDQYGTALTLIDSLAASSSDPKAHSFGFERAYVLYRLHRESEADAALKELDTEEKGVMHLEAQLKYRQGEYEAARDIYNDILVNHSPDADEHHDIITNLSATQKHIEFLSQGYLTSVHALPVSIAALEAAGAPSLPPAQSAFSASAPASASASQPPKPVASDQTPKPPRKSRIPAHVVPGVTPMPDPERWLKKRDRTRVQAGKKGRGRKDHHNFGAGATQGSVADDRGTASGGGVVTNVNVKAGGGGGKKGKKGR
ncbi:hypothetical protein BOTBODRAFT_51471 [Botryobasidium botryosum FD-172 SS1]|uniref:Signal recognition particle subunit SRP72 n=1 Tax=Botryobasidium botryosum (strain FD-172 SS1) TaxID=930990 RepID=A0A067N7M0_BOTB1|nr:hypothetical protein BOTBODRAFT_51471 [Botryobasidium botryosum FD-172 SS1]